MAFFLVAKRSCDFAAPCKPWRGLGTKKKKKKTLQGSSAHSLSPVCGGRMTLLARRTVSKRGEEVTHGTLASRLREEQEDKPPVGG